MARLPLLPLLLLPLSLLAACTGGGIGAGKGASDDPDDADGDGFLADEDCDDDDASVYPGATEVCNGKDDDCDGGIDLFDSDLSDGIEAFMDRDGDGFGDASAPTVTCTLGEGAVEDASDCDDNDPLVYPGAVERCSSGADDDCDGDTNDPDAEGCIDVYVDADGDGFGGTEHICLCSPDEAYPRYFDDDCDDAEPTTNPEAPERCNDFVDNDCDGGANDCELAGNIEMGSADGTVVGLGAGDATGTDLTRTGDLNGDGLDDFAVLAPGYQGSQGAVAAFAMDFSGELELDLGLGLLLGTATDGGLSRIEGGQDLDGDGLMDILVASRSTAGGAYLPGLSDYVIAVEDQASIYLAGPPLVQAALGESATDEELGGARMHATISGTAEYLAKSDAHALSLAREVVGALGWTDPATGPGGPPPRYDPDGLCGAIPADPRQPYDAREIIARIVDDSDFLEFKAGYGSQTLCGHARIDGHRVGLLANNGPIFPEGSVKAAQFIQLADQAGIPLVFLMNTTGYMVGTAAEQAGAIKHGSKMIQAVANATVPRITLVVGGSYGAGNYGMAGRGFDPDFIFSWPNAKVGVMGGEQAATVMKLITRAKFQRKGWPLDEEVLDGMAAEVRKGLDRESGALFATARLWDDGIIDPRDSRAVLSTCLTLCAAGRARTLHPNHFGVARG